MLPSLTFKDFTEYDRFLKIQNAFAMEDVQINHYEEPFKAILKNDFEIIKQEYNDWNSEATYEKASFYRSYLFPNIDTIPKRFINFFKKKLFTDVIFKPEDVKSFALHYSRVFLLEKQQIKDSQHLEVVLKNRLDGKLLIILDYLSKVHLNPMFFENDKIRFKMRRNEIILLFYLLKEKGYVDNRYDKDLGALIDRYFMYWNTTENEFMEISKSRVTLSGFNTGDRTYKKAFNNLQTICNKLIEE